MAEEEFGMLSVRILNYLRAKFECLIVGRSGLFDADWYLKRYPDISAANVDPLTHFMTFGYREDRDPNPIFSTRWHKKAYSLKETDNPILSYLGARKAGLSRKPNPWFDPVWYSQIHGLTPALDPMVHYLTHGAAEGNLPCANFPYQQRREGCATYANPLSHFWHRYVVKGYIGYCTSHYITGWAHRHTGPAIDLTISVNGVARGSVKPWIERPDVKELCGLDDPLGFFFVFPTRLRSGDEVEIRDEFGQPLSAEPITYTVAPLGKSNELYATRASIAASFLRGKGIEIGPYMQPTDLPPDCDVCFYDRMPPADLRATYDYRCGRPLFEPTVVGDAATLEGINGSKYDFIIANHLIEHLENPIAFLIAVSSALNSGGCAMLAAPDKRYSFDVIAHVPTFAGEMAYRAPAIFS